MSTRDIIVIGSSMGGIEALSALMGQLPHAFPAAIFIVQHTSPESPALLSQILDGKGALAAVTAQNGMAIEHGRIYVAPPDRHLLLSKEGMRIVFGPHENRTRPAIDPLFRTAAAHYRSRVVGVVLTGYLNDGAAGLLAVKRCGGVAVVQAPEDAPYPDMPRQALAAVDVDYVVSLVEMGALLGRLVTEPAPEPPPVPKDLLTEVRLTERAMENADWRELPGRPTLYTCPECGGVLREIGDEQLRRYRCHVGHAFTEHVLLGDQNHAIEEALWVALRTLQERAQMLESMAHDEHQRGRTHAAAAYRERAHESHRHAEQIRELLTAMV